MTASHTSTDGRIEVTDTAFQTAREFFDREQPARDRDDDAPAFAKGIVWYDPQTPLFCCCDCKPHVGELHGEGDAPRDGHEQLRTEAYRRLFEDDPTCDACSGELVEKVEA